MIIFAAYVLVVTGTYIGVLSPTGEEKVRFETTTDSKEVCEAIEKSILGTLSWQATDVVSSRCRKR